MRRLPFFYGWVMLPVVMLVSICTSPGQTFGISVFTLYLQEALGLSSSELSGAYMVGTMLAALPLTWVGAQMDRYGPRRVLIGVVLLFGLTCLGMTQVSGLFSLFVAFFFLRLLGQGSMSMLGQNALAMWFHRRLGFASGLSNVGMAAAVGGMPALSLFLIAEYGWRTAYAILGLGVWLLLLPVLAFVFRNRPEDMGQVADGGWVDVGATEKMVPVVGPELTLAQALRSRTYWITVCCMASWSMSGTGVQFHIVPIFAERGLGGVEVAAMFSIYALTIACGRLGGGILADKFPLNALIAAAMAFQGLGLALLNTLAPQWLPPLFPIAFAVGSGLLMSVGETIWVRYYGRRHLGKIRGSATTIGVAASGVGPFVMGVAYDFFGSFSQVLWACAALAVPLAVLGLWATPPKQEQAS